MFGVVFSFPMMYVSCGSIILFHKTFLLIQCPLCIYISLSACEFMKELLLV